MAIKIYSVVCMYVFNINSTTLKLYCLFSLLGDLCFFKRYLQSICYKNETMFFGNVCQEIKDANAIKTQV